MSTERDTHFKEFAKLLYQELSELSSEVIISEDLNEHEKQEILRIIAKRAYDLVEHAIEFLRWSPDIRPMQLTSSETWVQIIPDLTKWPVQAV